MSGRDFQLKVERFDFSIKSLLALPGKGEVHVWHAATDQCTIDIERLTSILSPGEKLRAARFRFRSHRSQFILSHVMLRLLIARYLELETDQISFTYGANGKPGFARGGAEPELQFNLSHTEGLAVCAFAPHQRIGIDVEKVRSDFAMEEIAERFFSEAERQALCGLPIEESYYAFFRCWTSKEAYIKAIGDGLSHPLDQFDVSIAADSAALISTRPDALEASRWSIQAVPVPAGYVAALAIETPGDIPRSNGTLPMRRELTFS